MSNRLTRKDLARALGTLNSMLIARGRQPYSLSIWSPGDGWTRYMLMGEGDSREISHANTLREIYEVVYTAIRIIEHAKL